MFEWILWTRTQDKYTMGNAEAERANAIRQEFAMPMDRWKTDSEEFKRMVESKSGIKVIVSKKGEEFQLQEAPVGNCYKAWRRFIC